MTHADFIAAITADPAADLPRLVYADWLEERGGADAERAAFIRCQVELARLDSVCCHQPGAKLGDGCNDSLCPRCGPEREFWRRERELLVRHYIQWTLGLPGGFLSHGIADDLLVFVSDLTPQSGARMQLRFRRGFIHAVTLTLADWLAHGPAVVRVAPVTAVTLVDREPWIVSERYVYWECDYGEADAPRFLSEVVFKCLEGGEEGCAAGHLWRQYDDGASDDHAVAVARAALSSACVRWARGEAGLPMVEGHPT